MCDCLNYIEQGIYILSLQWILTLQQVNVALKGKAAQSSAWDNYYYGHLAIDGNRASDFRLGSCAHTAYEAGPWWRVDLLAVHDISNVIITNRADNGPERITGAEIRIGNSLVNNGNNNPRCVIISSIPAGASANYTCNMRGRYVNVFIPRTECLMLCEVEVYGVPVPVTKQAFLRFKLKSIEDLTDPTTRDKVLQKIKSVNVNSSVFKFGWTMEPELETES